MPFKNIFLQSSICRKRENEIFSNSIRLKKKKKNILLSHDCRFVKDIPTSIIQKLSQRIWRIPPIPVYIFVATIKAGTGQTRLTAQFFFHRANIVIFSIFTPSCIYCYKQMTKFFVPQGYANFSYLELHLRRLFQYIRSYISHIYIFFENISWTFKNILILIFSLIFLTL